MPSLPSVSASASPARARSPSSTSCGRPLRPRRGLLRARRGDRRARRLRDLAARLAGVRGRPRPRLRARRREAGRGRGRLRRGRRRRRAGSSRTSRETLRALDPELHARLRLTAVEASARGPRGDRGPGHRARAPHPRRTRRSSRRHPSRDGSSRTSSTTPCRWCGSWARRRGLQELRVGREDGRFVWTASPAAEPLRRHLEELGDRARAGTEGRDRRPASASASAPGARARARVARRVRLRPPGAHPLPPLRAARGHARRAHRRAPRRRPARGSRATRDLTAHVNWDVLLAAGEAEGLRDRPARAAGHVPDGGRNLRLRPKRRREVADLPPRRSRRDGRRTLGSRSVAGASTSASATL